MVVIMRTLGIFLMWGGVAVISRVWVESSMWGMYKTWQFWVTLAIFTVAQALLAESGRREV